jgi:hypothetical protein
VYNFKTRLTRPTAARGDASWPAPYFAASVVGWLLEAEKIALAIDKATEETTLDEEDVVLLETRVMSMGIMGGFEPASPSLMELSALMTFRISSEEGTGVENVLHHDREG